MVTPTAMKMARYGLTRKSPTTPRATAPPNPTHEAVTSSHVGIDVARGRPCSSSRACAPTPTAKKNASTVKARRTAFTGPTRHEPITTKERCKSVYGGGSRGPQSRRDGRGKNGGCAEKGGAASGG